MVLLRLKARSPEVTGSQAWMDVGDAAFQDEGQLKPALRMRTVWFRVQLIAETHSLLCDGRKIQRAFTRGGSASKYMG